MGTPKVKIFQFQVCNAGCFASAGDDGTAWQNAKLAEIDWPQSMENTINKFLVGKTLLEIHATPYIAKNHNNSRANTVVMTYTVVYTVDQDWSKYE